MELRSRRFDVGDVVEAVEFCYERGWTDGLPVVPPTEARVAQILGYLGRDAQEVVGIIPPKSGVATLEKVAINCVMAGCLPEYVPVVLAALEAMLEEGFNLNGVEATQHPAEPLVIVGGPVVKGLGFNYGDGVFGGGSRANATVGRAIRLILWNIGGSVPGDIAKAPLSHPGRYSYCIAEHQEGNPWVPLHADLGLPPEASAVTVIALAAPVHLHLATESRLWPASIMLKVVADAMAPMGSSQLIFLPEVLVVLGPGPAAVLAREGWGKQEIRAFLFEKARRRLGDLAEHGWYDRSLGYTRWPRWIDQTNDETLVPVVQAPEHIHILVSGGPLAAAWLPGWHFSWAQAKAINFPGGRGDRQ